MYYLDYAKRVGDRYILNFFADSIEDLKDVPATTPFIALNGTNYGIPLETSVVTIVENDIRVNYVLQQGKYIAGGDIAPVVAEKTITENGTYVAKNENLDGFSSVTVDVPTGAELNIAYGDTPPEDTSKLWIKSAEPENIEIAKQYQTIQDTVLPVELHVALDDIPAAVVGTKIYTFGGEFTGNYTGDIQIIDLETQTTTFNDQAIAIATGHNLVDAATVAVGNNIYIFGGGASNESSSHGEILKFDTTTNTLTKLSTLLPYYDEEFGDDPHYVAAVAVGTKIYTFCHNFDVQVFDAETETFTHIPNTNCEAQSDAAAVAVGTKIYLFGGIWPTSSLEYDYSIHVYDTEAKKMTELQTTLAEDEWTDQLKAVSIGTKVYLFSDNLIQEFDTETEVIYPLPTSYAADVLYPGAAVTANNEIYLIGGATHKINVTSSAVQKIVVDDTLAQNDIFIREDTESKAFMLLSAPTKVEIGVKNVYKGNASNVAEFVDAYLYDGANWVNINTGEVFSTGETWKLNDTVVLLDNGNEIAMQIDFSVKGTEYNDDFNTFVITEYLGYFKNDGSMIEAYKSDEGWYSNDLKTVIFATAPSGELLTWLKANGVKISTKIN